MAKRRSKHRYDWHPDIPDRRDYLFAERVKAPKKLPAQVDLRPQCPPVANQGQVGSCTGNALAGALEFLELRELRGLERPAASGARDKSSDPEVYTPGKYAAVSRLFIYFNERLLEGHEDQDSGGSLRDGIQALCEYGACREALWKYVPSKVLTRPSAKAYTEGEDHRISSYLRIEDLAGIRQSLALGFPVAFGFTVYESFESPEVARTGIMPVPSAGEQALGGHAVLAVGYDDRARKLIVRNSWGPKWGQRGYFVMPYDCLDLARDFWTIRK